MTTRRPSDPEAGEYRRSDPPTPYDRALAEIARLTAINAELRSPADGWRETLVEIEHARKTFDVYQRVHSELEDGKLFTDIDCGLRSPPKWKYASWLAYMQQHLINHLRGILLVSSSRALKIPSPPTEETET